MSYIIFTFALLALFHFIYEGILAPSFRMKLRFDLCALQGDLDRLSARQPGAPLEQHYCQLRDSVTALIAMLHRFDAATLVVIEQALRSDQLLRERLEARERTLNACDVPEVRELRERFFRIATYAMAVNHGGWSVYGFPIVLAYLGLARVRRLIRAAASLSTPDLLRIAPG